MAEVLVLSSGEVFFLASLMFRSDALGTRKDGAGDYTDSADCLLLVGFRERIGKLAWAGLGLWGFHCE